MTLREQDDFRPLGPHKGDDVTTHLASELALVGRGWIGDALPWSDTHAARALKGQWLAKRAIVFVKEAVCRHNHGGRECWNPQTPMVLEQGRIATTKGVWPVQVDDGRMCCEPRACLEEVFYDLLHLKSFNKHAVEVGADKRRDQACME